MIERSAFKAHNVSLASPFFSCLGCSPTTLLPLSAWHVALSALGRSAADVKKIRASSRDCLRWPSSKSYRCDSFYLLNFQSRCSRKARARVTNEHRGKVFFYGALQINKARGPRRGPTTNQGYLHLDQS